MDVAFPDILHQCSPLILPTNSLTVFLRDIISASCMLSHLQHGIDTYRKPNPKRNGSICTRPSSSYQVPLSVDIDTLSCATKIPTMVETMTFVWAIRDASLMDPVAKLSTQVIDIDNPGVRFSISVYLALQHSSQAAYNTISYACKHLFVGTPGAANVLSFYEVEKLISIYTGVEPICYDMCLKTCLAFTGPYSDLKQCTHCNSSQWHKAKPYWPPTPGLHSKSNKCQ